MRIAVAALAGRTIASRPLAIGVALLVATEALLAILGLVLPMAILLRRLARGVCDLELRSDRQHGSTAHPPLDGWRVGMGRGACSAACCCHDPAGGACVLACPCRASRYYPWAAEPSAIPADVARWYLNQPSFLIRALITLGGKSSSGNLRLSRIQDKRFKRLSRLDG
jgi:hypothetical protein